MNTASILFLTFVNLLNYMDRYMMPAVLTSVQRDLGLSNTRAGILVSAFTIGYFIFSPLFGYLGDRYNRVKLMALGVFLWSLATITSGLVSGFWLLLAVRAFVGIGEASFASIAPGYFKDRLQDPVRLGKTLALFFAAIPVGSALGYAFAGAISASYGWKAVFWIGGAPGIVAALLILFFKESSNREISSVDIRAGLKEIVKVRTLWFAVGGYILNSFALNGVATFVISYGQEIGFSQNGINLAFGIILVVTGSVGTIVGGRWATAIASRSTNAQASLFRFTALSALLGAPCLAVAFLCSDHLSFLAFCFLAELLIFAGVGPVNAIIVNASPKSQVTLTQSVSIFCLNLLGSLPAPPVIGFLADTYSISTALQFSAGALCVSALIWWQGNRAEKIAAN